MNQKGFSLIELLVVLAILGALSSIVLFRLNQARLNAFDARIKIELSSLIRSSAIYYDGAGNKTYGSNANDCLVPQHSMFRSDPIIQRILASLMSISPNVQCRSNSTDFAISATLTSVSGSIGNNWCIDSSGMSKAINCSLPSGVNNVSCNSACP